jgi:hypothetical protein
VASERGADVVLGRCLIGARQFFQPWRYLTASLGGCRVPRLARDRLQPLRRTEQLQFFLVMERRGAMVRIDEQFFS